jgi:hypothetical protein
VPRRRLLHQNWRRENPNGSSAMTDGIESG